jgi:dihydrofolate synthase/folylpolyglutamate synthase
MPNRTTAAQESGAPGEGAGLDRWLEYLERLHPAPIDLGLERVAAVRSRMALTLAAPVFTVGGTNGKGSVCAYLEAILREAGFRAGLYTSPHLLRYNERVRIDAAEVDDARLVQAFERIERARGDISLTYFEFGTLAAALIFAQARIDVAILEVGLGGRLDAVNIFDADCAIVASVDLDHMQLLGDTREAIGREKAGIFRADVPAVCGDFDPPSTLTEHARALGARLLLIGKDYGYAADAVQWRYWGPRGKRGALPYPAMRGTHQLGNAATAIAALDELKPRLPVGVQAIRMGLATAHQPGRYQVLPGRPAVVLDVAHNPHAARALAGNLAQHRGFRRTLAVFSMLADKDIGSVVAQTRHAIDAWYVAAIDTARAESAATLARLIESLDPDKPIELFGSIAQAYRAACDAADDDDRILAFGSFHTVAEVLAAGADKRAAGQK